ncbi:MarR family winged helix-turn-helix transcriptional regulator [Sphingopyxis sp. 550A]
MNKATPSPEESVAFQVRRMHLGFSRYLESKLADHEVKVSWWYYLRALEQKDNVTQKDLSKATNVTATTTVAVLKGMEEEGLITRTPDTIDRRQVFVALTSKGRALANEIIPYAAEGNILAKLGIPQREIEMCRSVLKRMAENIDRYIRSEIEA